MIQKSYDAIVVGGGSAGLAAALAIRAEGFSAAIVEREPFLGGILLQCIHNGFGLHEFGQDLTGPQYADRFVGPILDSGADVYLDATVMEIVKEDGGAKTLTVFSQRKGICRLRARAVVLSMGCRERNRGNVAIAGTRPAGVFTAGLAQRLVNVEGCIPGKRVVIIGSGDIGLIMARRLTLVGCEVPAVIEIQPWPSGIVRNIVQCLNDFSIPLHLAHVVTRIEGRQRVSGVQVAPLIDGRPDDAKGFHIDCDTVLLSVGLIPENELSRAAGVPISASTGGPVVDGNLMTGVDGVFACGNVLHVHDLVDYVTEESRRCGQRAAAYLRGESSASAQLPVVPGANVRYVTPGSCVRGRENVLYMRPLIVKNEAQLSARMGGTVVKSRKLAHVQPSEMIRLELSAQDLPEPGPEGAAVLEVSIQ